MDAYSVFIQSLLLIIIGLFPEWKFKSRMEKTDIPGIYSLHFPKNSLVDCLLSWLAVISFPEFISNRETV